MRSSAYSASWNLYSSVWFMLACAVGASCTDTRKNEPAAILVTDDAGREVRLQVPARRVVSLVPAATEVLLALGAADRIVARSDYDSDPRVAHLPSVGGGLTPSIEWIAAAKPDLVIAWPDDRARSVLSRLANVGIPIYAARIDGIEDTDRTTRNVGKLVGEPLRADSINAAARDTVRAVQQRVAGLPRTNVLYLIELDPPMSARPGTFIDEIINIAGGRNIFPEAKSGAQQVSLEEIMRRNPDHILVSVFGFSGDEPLSQRPGWRDVNAVRQGRVTVLDANVFNRPGPGISANASALARILHPLGAP
jgi:iron complex transport system substrate-binding protein